MSTTDGPSVPGRTLRLRLLPSRDSVAASDALCSSILPTFAMADLAVVRTEYRAKRRLLHRGKSLPLVRDVGARLIADARQALLTTQRYENLEDTGRCGFAG